MTRGLPVHISMAVDVGYAMPLAAVLAGIAANHGSGECAVTVLHGGLDEKARARVAGNVEARVPITWIRVDETVLAGAHFPRFLSPATLYRLLLPSVLPAE